MKKKNSEILKLFNKLSPKSLNQTIIAALNDFSLNYDVNLVIDQILDELVSGKNLNPRNLTSNKIILKEKDGFELSVFYNLPQENQSIKDNVLYSYPTDMYFCPLTEVKESKIKIYKQNQELKENILDTDSTLVFDSEEYVIPNQTVFIERFSDIFELDKSLFFMAYTIFVKEWMLNYSWEYDAKTLAPVRVVLTNLTIGRLMTSLKIIGINQYLDSKEILIKLTNHDEHCIRWEAVRSLINIDFEEGKKVLNSMLHDKHPEVRNAAKKSLQIIN